jgi:uroporphyrinogen-III synthase
MRVILFRTPAPGDTYTSAFAAAGYTATSIPALEDSLLPAALEPVIARGGATWEAAIITSRRAAEAWVLAAERVAGQGLDASEEGESAPVVG